MNKKIIVIEGYLASGKSTFAVQLSKTLTIPYLIKDTFKIALCSSLSIADRYESSRFSAVTFDAMMYVIHYRREFCTCGNQKDRRIQCNKNIDS